MKRKETDFELTQEEGVPTTYKDVNYTPIDPSTPKKGDGQKQVYMS